MTQSNPTGATRSTQVHGWTCAGCEMTVSWMPDAEDTKLPSTWVKEDGALYCLSCRRDRAGDQALEGLPDDASTEVRHRTRSQGRLEFEILRDPGRPDGRIAKSCRTSTPAVRKARARLGLQSPPPA